MGTVDELITKYMVYVDRVAAAIPYGRTTVWKEFFFNPAATTSKNIISTMAMLKELYVMNSINIIIAAVGLVPTLFIQSAFAGMTKGVGVTNGLATLWLTIGILVIGLLFGPIGAYLYSLLEYLVARFLGGTGNMNANFNATSLSTVSVMLVLLPISIILVPVRWVSAIPILNLCTCIILLPLSLISGIVGLYSIYLRYAALKAVHNLSTIRAALVVLVPIALVVIVAIVAFFMFYAMLMAMLLGPLAMRGMTGGY